MCAFVFRFHFQLKAVFSGVLIPRFIYQAQNTDVLANAAHWETTTQGRFQWSKRSSGIHLRFEDLKRLFISQLGSVLLIPPEFTGKDRTVFKGLILPEFWYWYRSTIFWPARAALRFTRNMLDYSDVKWDGIHGGRRRLIAWFIHSRAWWGYFSTIFPLGLWSYCRHLVWISTGISVRQIFDD